MSADGAETDAATRFLRRVRRVILFVALASVLYAAARFDVVRLPERALSPLHGIHAGDRLLVDRRARGGAPEEIWLFHGPAGELLLGRARAAPDGLAQDAHTELAAGALWLESEREIPGVADSRELGPIAPAALVGRVVLVLPW
jgi:hypothetical protein